MDMSSLNVKSSFLTETEGCIPVTTHTSPALCVIFGERTLKVTKFVTSLLNC